MQRLNKAGKLQVSPWLLVATVVLIEFAYLRTRSFFHWHTVYLSTFPHSQLSEYESMIAVNIVDPSELHVGWKDIGGLDSTIEVLKVRLPLCQNGGFIREFSCFR